MQIGRLLKEARKERGLSLSQVSQELLIQEKYLQALEEGNYELIPGEAYQRAFFRAYSEYLGLSDYIETLTQTRNPAPEEDKSAIEEVFGGPWDSARWFRVIAKIGGIILIIALIVVGVKARVGQDEEIDEGPDQVNSTRSLDVVTETSKPRWRFPEPGEILDPAEHLAAMEHRLRLTARGECWVNVYTRDGTLFSGNMHIGDSLTYTDVIGFVVHAGRPEKLDVEFNGDLIPWASGETTMNLPAGSAILDTDDEQP